MSPRAAGLAKEAGYTNIKVMLAGVPAWKKKGYPLYASDEFVNRGNIVLIDLRAREKSRRSRIPRSVTIPFSELDDRLDDIPPRAPVVLYSDNAEEAEDAAKKLRKEGIKNVSLVYGDLGRWLESPAASESGPVVTEINWVRKPGRGEVSVADFTRALSGRENAVILDVRTPEECEAGAFPGALHIPLDELPRRTGELPVNKKIYIHCTTGARAEMAYRQLIKDGYRAYFLVADITCDEGACEIDE